MKRTYQPNNRKKAKKHGFFSRIKGNVLKSRRAKKDENGKWQLISDGYTP